MFTFFTCSASKADAVSAWVYQLSSLLYFSLFLFSSFHMALICLLFSADYSLYICMHSAYPVGLVSCRPCFLLVWSVLMLCLCPVCWIAPVHQSAHPGLNPWFILTWVYGTGLWYWTLSVIDFASASPLVLLLDWTDLSALTFAWLWLPFNHLSCCLKLVRDSATQFLLFSLQTQSFSSVILCSWVILTANLIEHSG